MWRAPQRQRQCRVRQEVMIIVLSTIPQPSATVLYKNPTNKHLVSSTASQVSDDVVQIENEKLALRISSKGGRIISAILKNFQT